jgi:hypothetical protein
VDTKKGKLRPNAFRPSPGTDEISVMRSSVIGPHRCKKKALKLEDPAATKVYRGFAVLSVRAVRAAHICVVDSRKENFLGHADIRTGNVTPLKGVPGEPREIERSKAICDLLTTHSKYYADPSPAQSRWRGERLIPLEIYAISI